MAMIGETTLNRDRKRVLVTGAGGFIGRRLCSALIREGWDVIGQVRTPPFPEGIVPLVTDLDGLSIHLATLPHLDAVVHLAGMAHLPVDRVNEEYLWHVNVSATRKLAKAVAERAAHLIYISSAKVLGENGEWDDNSNPAPVDLYARSKLAAEEAIGSTDKLFSTILRPPLVYGQGVKGNFHRMLRLADSGWLLPFASLHNPRSLIFADNLTSAIISCLNNTQSIGQTWLVSDGEALQVRHLLRLLSLELRSKARLFHVNPSLLVQAARLVGKGTEVGKLTGRFVIHDKNLRSHLGWQPPYSILSGIHLTVEWYKTERMKR